ncbi:NAD(P)/FAD-dependent oxidoreductase [Clostridium sp. CM028]|uniref:NAD(P)/FAD-dependent oxidoreductase n=1 Tax=unclassified Clostridium TaxID=2614128 RepID=UPI001C6E554E|nr:MULTISPECIES: NAD(P)/FAD-dependent oxidoreductase [unclassified Clostridium]MBW9144888.1 NAD(P)/FAD-dependent oxidoreductase [Clostridium sp. CM027]MBW9148693.1 NAD(P)/FAD-dependent oxidoreductase [Clostridium sp. CM028]UVE40031.1 NAD(P)/FAD-dependent oxidoreductase [Clostridium sp. CM027]WLC60720.1 NAD(P)/FAD-dependent oxidoreductase [Clostridium sp. CM028]
MKNFYDVVIVGAGPAGIFTALEISNKKPELSVLIVDKGRNIEKRKCPARDTGKCVKCNPCGITFGWAGAGAFSDGKLSLSPEVGGRLLEYFSEDDSKKLIKYCDDIYIKFGANEKVYGINSDKVDEVKYEASKHNIRLVECPVRHLGTELAYEVLKSMYHHLVDNTNTEFIELSEVEEILIEDNKATGVLLKNKDGVFKVNAKYVVAAPGRGGAEWASNEAKKHNIKVTNNAVDIGVRVEVPNSVMDHLTKDLYEAKLVYYSDTFDNKVRTFCMNPGGVVSAEYYDDNTIAVVNGHSYSDQKLRTTNTNFAMLVSTTFTEPFNQPIGYGKYIAQLGNMLTGGGIMVQRLGDLLKGRRTDYDRLGKSTTTPTLKSAVPGDLSFVLPQRHLTSIVEALKAFDKIAPGLYSKNTLLYGVEVKFYSSKISTDDKFETSVRNLYTIGDGAGITRGLMQASTTGVVVARDIAQKED